MSTRKQYKQAYSMNRLARAVWFRRVVLWDLDEEVEDIYHQLQLIDNQLQQLDRAIVATTLAELSDTEIASIWRWYKDRI